MDYTTKGPPDATPEPDEDRTLNRMRLAARLLSLLRTQGREEADLFAELRSVEAAFDAGRRPEAGRRVEMLLSRIDRALTDANLSVDPARKGRARTP